MATYDAVKWHVLTRQKVPLNVAVIHFYAIMNWLKQKDLLTDVGQNAKIDLQFELDSSLLKPLGNEILSRVYNIWAQQVDYRHKPKPHILEKAYNLLKNKKSKNVSNVIQQQNIAADSTAVSNNITKSSTLEQEIYTSLCKLYTELQYLRDISK